MKNHLALAVSASAALCLGYAIAHAQGQYPIVERVAQRVIEKYEGSSCAELAAQRGRPPSQEEERAVRLLHEDPGMRTAFIDRVAGPIANKMFECNLIP